MAKKHMQDADRVAVIGLGRFGVSLAGELVTKGIEVLGVDANASIVQQNAAALTHAAVADSTDQEALRQLGIDEFAHVVVAIGTALEASILTTSLLADFGVPDIWAKATTRQQGRILERIGAHHVVLPEHDMGERVAHLVAGRRLLDYVQFDEGYVMGKIRAPRELIGIPLGESGVRRQYGVTVVAVRRAGGEFGHADLDTVIADRDLLIVAGRQEAVELFATRS